MTPAPDNAVLLHPLFGSRDHSDEITIEPYVLQSEEHAMRLLGRARRPVDAWPELFLLVRRSDRDLTIEAELYLMPGAPRSSLPTVHFELGLESVAIPLEYVGSGSDRPRPTWRGRWGSMASAFDPEGVRLALGGAR